LRICSRISVALMPQNYPDLPHNQAINGRLIHSAFRTPHSALQ
jgi:hypothetical protein